MEKTNKKPAAAGKQINIKMIHSTICANPKQRKTMVALGLNKIGQVKTYPDNACVRGMIKIVSHLVQVEE